eukprot:g1960.t1
MIASKRLARQIVSKRTQIVAASPFSSEVPARAENQDVLEQVHKDFEGKDAFVKIVPNGKDSFDVTTVDCKDKVEELKLEGDNAVSLLLSKEEEQGGLLEAVGLGPWYKKASLGFIFGVTALSKEMYIMNEETFVAGCLGGFGMVLYLFGRQPMLDWYNGEKKAMLDAQNDAENRHIAAIDNFLNSQKSTEGLEAELAELAKQKKELLELEAQANAIKEKVSVNAEFTRRLVAIVNKKADEQNQLYKAMVADAKAYAAKGVEKPEFQKLALEFAIKAIATPDKAGANPTGKLFEEFLEKRK